MDLCALLQGGWSWPGSVGWAGLLWESERVSPDDRGGGFVEGFDATPAELQMCGVMLADLSQEVRTKMGVLESEVETLLGGGWQGGAARGFAQGWEQWRAGAREVLEALADMGRLLGDTGRDYDLTDEGAADSLRRSGEGR